MKQPFYFDGAFGTYYNGLYHSEEPCEYANLQYPERVMAIHKAYIKVGVNAIKTNTFGVNSTLSDCDDTLCELIRSGYRIAMQAVEGTDVRVFCDIGYIDGDRQEAEYLRNVDCFLQEGGKYFLFETLQEYEPLSAVISYLRKKAPNAVVMVSFSVSQDGYTQKGYFYENLLQRANKDADTVGLNCQCGPAHLYQLIQRIDLTEFSSFSAMPNAGYPHSVNGRTVYSDNKEYYAQKLLSIATLGVNVIGGCCGTTPDHLRPIIGKQISFAENTVARKAPAVTARKNRLIELFKSGKKVLAVEIDPPVDTDVAFFLQSASILKHAGADVITVADSPLARTRADSIMLAAKLKREIGIEVLPHLSCRDKNYIAIRGMLLGGNIEQVNNILVVTGDPISRSEGGVFQFNSFTLMNLISNLNREVFLENPYTVCGALNVNAQNFDAELQRAQKKIASGTMVLLTQPIFSSAAVLNFKRAKEMLDCYLMAGILPIASWKNAMFLNNEVSGIEISADFIAMLQKMSADEVQKASVVHSMQMIQAVFSMADGFYIMTPLKKVGYITDLLAEIKKYQEDR